MKKKKLTRWIILAGTAAVLFGAAKYLGWFARLQELLRTSIDWIHGLGAAGPIIFIGFYIVLCVLLIPGSVLTLGAGYLFGVGFGTFYTSIASVAGASCAFFVGRYLARDWVARKIEGNPKFKAIDEAVAKEGWRIVALTRLTPVFPFTLLNYAYGLTKVRFTHFLVASWIAMLPGTVLYVYLGSLGNSLTVSMERKTKSPLEWGFYIFGLVITLVVTVYITRIAKKALAKRVAG